MAQYREPVGPAGELSGYFTYYFPGAGDYDLFDRGYGVEVQYRHWFDAPLGWALSLGVATWDAKSGSSDLGVPNFHSFDGSATLIPFGASGLYRLIDAPGFAATLEVGIRYVIVDDDIDFKDSNRGDAKQSMRIDDGVVGIIGVDVDFQLDERTALALGVGYQGDLIKGDSSTSGASLKDNELQAFFVRAGVKFQF
jgi:opacity protein-like surface antigen